MSLGALAEMRSRLIAGLKRYYHGKRMEGLLSVQVGGRGLPPADRIVATAGAPWRAPPSSPCPFSQTQLS